jgi:hypothetical protein
VRHAPVFAADAYSGRSVYDEQYVANFIHDHGLPLNSTTPWLTPGFRVRNATLTLDLDMVGRPKGMYVAVLQLLDDAYQGRVLAEDILAEMIRWLLIVKEERRQRMESLEAALASTKGETPLSVDEIVGLVEQHLQQKRSARLPVLVVTAAYQAAEHCLGERVLPLESHNAADKQTGSLGDLEITLVDDDDVVTSYEMKKKRVDKLDIDHAMSKLADSGKQIDNYIFITTEEIDPVVGEYASIMYDKIGVEITILDCITFLRYFLYLFYRLRINFLEAYQELVLTEPDSAVSQPLKEVFLSLRHAAESGE